MRPFSMGSINALVKHGGAAALNDPAAQEKVKRMTIQIRKETTSALTAYGYDVIPSETNFFMVHLGRQVQPVIEEFREKGILVGRPFPPMLEHLRVSVGTEDDMGKFLTAFKQIFPARTATAARARLSHSAVGAPVASVSTERPSRSPVMCRATGWGWSWRLCPECGRAPGAVADRGAGRRRACPAR